MAVKRAEAHYRGVVGGVATPKPVQHLANRLSRDLVLHEQTAARMDHIVTMPPPQPLRIAKHDTPNVRVHVVIVQLTPLMPSMFTPATILPIQPTSTANPSSSTAHLGAAPTGRMGPLTEKAAIQAPKRLVSEPTVISDRHGRICRLPYCNPISWPAVKEEQLEEAVRNVVVLGMHRSGTSAVTRAINLMGIPLGRESDLHSGQDNPLGHWESNSLVLANDLILAQFHGSFTFPPNLRSGWEGSLNTEWLLPHLAALFGDVYPQDAWLWKDPRLCLTLPLWRRILAPFCVVLVIRNPNAVTDSLRSRDGLPLAYCHALWDRYNRSAVRNLEGLPVAIVEFDALESDPSRELKRLAQALESLGVHLPGFVSDAVASIKRLNRVSSVSQSRSSAGMWSELQNLPRVSQSFERRDLSKSVWASAATRAGRLWTLRSAFRL